MDVVKQVLFMKKLKPMFCSTAIARIDRLGQTRPTEGQEKSDLDTITAYFQYIIFGNSILLLR